MIDIASLNSNLPKYFEALDSSNSNSNQTLLPNNVVNTNNASNNESIPTQSFMGESALLPNNNNVVLQGPPNAIPSSTIIQPPAMVQQNVLQSSPVTLHSNSLLPPPNSVYSANTVMYNNTAIPNTVNNSDIFQQSSQPSPSPYNNNTIVSPVSRVAIPNQPQYVLNNNIPIISYPNASPHSISVNQPMNTPLNPSTPISQTNFMNQSNIIFPPNTLMGPQGNMSHAYSAPVFSNNLSPPSLPNYEMNTGILAVPSNAITNVNSTSNSIQTPIISNQISSNILPSNPHTPMTLNNSLIIPSELSTDLTTSIDISTPLVMTSSMPILTNDLSTPLQGTSTPVLPSTLFNVNSTDSAVSASNASLVIPSDLTCSITLDNQQVSTLDSLSPPLKVNSIPSVGQQSFSIPSATPPTKMIHFDYPVRTEDVPLLNVGATPSVQSKDFVNSLPTPKDNTSMKCTFNKEGITLDNISKSPQQEYNKSLEMKMPISPKEEHRGSASILNNKINKASFPSPKIDNKKVGDKNITITVLNQEVIREEPISIDKSKNISKVIQKPNTAVAMPTPKVTPSVTPYVNAIATPLSSSMPTPLATPSSTPKVPELSTPLTKAVPTPITLSIDSKKTNPVPQDHHKRISKKKKSLGKNITAPVVLSSLTSVVGSIKARSNLNVSDKKEKEVIIEKQPIVKEENKKSEVSVVPKTVPVKFTEPLTTKESFTFTEPPVFVDPLNKESSKSVSILKENKKKSSDDKTSSVLKEDKKKSLEDKVTSVSKEDKKKSLDKTSSILKEDKKKSLEGKAASVLKEDKKKSSDDKTSSVIELVKEANIKNKSQSLEYTKYLLEKKFTYPKANKPKKATTKSDESDKNVSRNHVVELPSPAVLKPKNYTEPLPFIDSGDFTLEELLSEETIQNKNLSYNDIIDEDTILKPKNNQLKESEKENIMNNVNNGQKEVNKKNTEIVRIKRKEESDKKDNSQNKKRKTEEKKEVKDSKKRQHEESEPSREHKKKKRSKQDSKKKHKDISEDGVMSKVKYNSNNISLYVSELKVLTKFQTKDDQDIYPLRCVCEGDLEEKELGLEDLVCTYPNCNKSFVKSIHLEKHFIEHGDDFRPYQCPNCTKNFRRRYDLMRHSRIHNYIIPYRCSRCLRGFTRSDSCARHTKTRQCKYFDFDKINEKKENPPYYIVVKDPSDKTEKDIIIIPLNKEKIKD